MNIIRVIWSLVFSSIVVFVIPYALGNDAFIDIKNYLARVEVLVNQGADFDTRFTLTNYIFREQLWSYYLLGSVYIGLDPIIILKIASYITSTFIFYLVFYFSTSITSGVLVSFLLAVNPMFIDLINAQVRSALSVAILFLGIFVFKGKFLRLSAIILSLGIHTVSLVFILIHYIFKHFIDKLGFKTSVLLSIVSAIFFGVFIKFGLPIVLEAIGDRRADVLPSGSSIVYSMFWPALMTLAFIFFKSEKLSYEIRFHYFLSVFFSFLFFVLSILNIYGSRFIALYLPFILVIMFFATKNRWLLIMPFVCYEAIQIYYWL